MKLKRWSVTALFMTAALLNVTAASGQDSSMAKVTIKLSIVKNTCRINGDRAIKAEFGEVPVNKLNLATANVPITIACDDKPQGTLSMELKGTESAFDTHALQTDRQGLGITFTSAKSESVDLNTFYDVTSKFGLTSKTGAFNLTAHLTSDSKTVLAGGEFNASATLILQVS